MSSSARFIICFVYQSKRAQLKKKKKIESFPADDVTDLKNVRERNNVSIVCKGKILYLVEFISKVCKIKETVSRDFDLQFFFCMNIIFLVPH